MRPLIPAERAAHLVDPAAYADGRIDETYRWLRANMPLGLATPDGFDPFWVVTRHADLQAVSRGNSLFLSGERATTLATRAHIDRTHEITGCPHLVKSLVQMDGIEHRQYRALTQPMFMPARLRDRVPVIERFAREAVDAMHAFGGACEFMGDVAQAYPLRVVMQFLGVPEEDYPRMLKLTQELFGPQDPDTTRVVAALTAKQYSAVIEAAVSDFGGYFANLSDARRQMPQDDLATLIANAQIDGRPIGAFEATGYYIIVATAGHDTTSSSLGAIVWALASQPGLLTRIKAQPELIPGLVEEGIRWATPVKTFMRSAATDTILGGQPIGRGDWLMLCYASANRDELALDHPFSFDIDRKPNAHLAFSLGAHSCIGQHLARLELKLFVDALIPRLESIACDGDPRFINSWFVSGLKRLPIRYEMMAT